MAGDREPEASRRSPHGSACGFANLRYRAIRFVRRHSARIHSPILSFATQTCDCVHVFRVLLGSGRQGSNFLSVRCFGPVTSRPLLGALSLLCRHAMAAHKLRIACVVTLAMLGFGRHVQAASLTLAWDHSTSSNTAGYLSSRPRHPIRQIHGNGQGRLCHVGQYHRPDRRDDVLLHCAVLRQRGHARLTVPRNLW